MTINQNPDQSPEVTSAPSVDSGAVPATAKKSKARRNALLATGAVGLVGIGSTLAANISLNGGNNVEFGQGVAKTTACDEDGFIINPVTSYDNRLSIWRLDRVEISGLNLTPVGSGFSSGGYSTQDEAKTAHPGEYYDNGWKRTCDGVVLDFKAYTDDINYWKTTRDAYVNSQGYPNTSTPVGWAQYDGNVYSGNNSANYGYAVVIDTADDNSSEVTNFGLGDSDTYGSTDMANWGSLDHSQAANSSFSFNATLRWRPDAASISKIAVASMAIFPANYNLNDDQGIGRG